MTSSLNQKSVTVTPSDVCDTFQGWHFLSSSVGGITVGAFVCNHTKEHLEEKLRDVGAIKLPSYTDLAPTQGCRKYFDSVFLENSPFQIKKSFFVKPTVWVSGSTVDSRPSLCQVDGYVQKTPLFQKIEVKACQHIIDTYDLWYEAKLCDEAVNIEKPISTECLAYKLMQSDDKTNTIKSFISELIKLPTKCLYVTALYDATLLHHTTSTDGGTQFRDKLGRSSASEEVSSAVNAVLFVV